MHLVLFFTRDLTLRIWDDSGLFDREVALYHRLMEHGVRVSFITYGGRAEEAYRDRLGGIGLLCNSIPVKPGRYVRWLPLLHGPTLARADVLKTNQTDGGEQAVRAARLWRKPLIARGGYGHSDAMRRIHGPDSAQAAAALALERRLFGAADRVVVTTARMADEAAQIVPAARVTVIPNYVDTARFAPDDSAPDYDVLFVGRLSAEKGVAALLEALEPLSARALIVGEGAEQDALQRRYGDLDGRLTWHERVPNSQLPALMRRARIFALPSQFENMPKALIEAMACGLAVVGADVRGIQELIRDGETGLLVPPGDPAALRAAIKRLIETPRLGAALGAAARREVIARFSLDHVVELELAVLHEVTRR